MLNSTPKKRTDIMKTLNLLKNYKIIFCIFFYVLILIMCFSIKTESVKGAVVFTSEEDIENTEKDYWDTTYWIINPSEGTFYMHGYFDEDFFEDGEEIEEIFSGEEYKDCITIGNAIYSKDKKTLLLYNPKNIKNDFVIPDFVTKIGPYAFADCGLEKVIFGSGITKISKSAFRDCSDLKTIKNGQKEGVIPDSVTKIGSYAFSGCKRLEKITIGSGITEIPKGAFRCCWLKTIKLGKNVKYIRKGAFYNHSREAYCSYSDWLKIPDSVISIEKQAFLKRPFKKIKIGKNLEYGVENIDLRKVKKIVVNCQNKHYKLKNNMLISKNSKTIYRYVGKAKKVKINRKARIIERTAFYRSPVQKLIGTKGIREIKELAFYGSNISSFNLSKKIKYISATAFKRVKFKKLIINANLKVEHEDIFMTNYKYKRMKILQTWLPPIQYKFNFKKIIPVNVGEWTWSAVLDANGYQIQCKYNDGNKKFTKKIMTNTTGIPIKALEKYHPNYPKKYRIRAYKLNKKGKKIYTKWSKWGYYSCILENDSNYNDSEYLEYLKGSDDPG